MTSFLSGFFTQKYFIPHGVCLAWDPSLMLLFILSDSAIAIAYYTIPFALIYFIYKRRDLAFRGIFALTGAFILACGTTHVMDVVTLWYPAYWLDAAVKFITAVVSMFTAAAMWWVMPAALALPSTRQLEDANRHLQHEIGERERAQAALREANEELERRVVARTAELEDEVVQRRRTEETLRESEEQWREVFEHNPVMYFMVGAAGTVLSVNAFGAAQLGYTPGELIGQSVLTVFFEEDQELVKGHVATCLEEVGRSHSWEIRKIRKDGGVIWVRENAKTVRRPGDAAIVLIACEDITERRRAERRRDVLYAVAQVLAESDSFAAAAPHLLQAIGENLEWDWGALWSFGNREGGTLRCDCLWHAPHIATTELAEFDMIRQERSFAAGQGRLGQVWRSGLPTWMVDAATEPDFLRASNAASAGLHGGVIFPILLDTDALGVAEFFSRAPRERDEEQLATLSAIGSQIGQFIKRRSAELAVRAAEDRWRRLFETSAAGMALEGLDGVFTAANPALQRMLGRTEEEIVGHNVLELNHEDERAATADALAKFRSGSLTERHVEKKYLKKDGSLVWLDITTTLVPAIETAAPFLQAVYVDVTRRVQSEAALRASNERWRAIFESAAVGIATGDLDGGVLSMNPAFQRTLGYTEDEIRNLTVFEFTHEEDRAETRRFFSAIITGRQTSYRFEKRYRRKDGATIWADVSASMVPATDTTPAFLAVMAVDITDRKQAEAALRASEERWRAMFETAPVGIATLDFGHRSYLTANESFQRMTGYSENELRQLTTLDITHEDDRAATQGRIDSAIVGVLQRKRYRRKDGEVIWADVTPFVVPATDGTPAFLGAVIVDVTDRRRAEDALRRSEAYLNEVFDTFPDGVSIIGRDYRYQRVNHTYEVRTGLGSEQIVGMHLADRVGLKAFNEIVKTELDRCLAGEHVSYAYWLTPTNSGRRYLEVTYAPIFISGPNQASAALAITRDLTEYMLASEALRQAQADLARLNRIMLLGEMTSSIAHEVNQPIAAVITNANAGLRWLGARPPNLEEARQTLARIVRDGNRAGEVIDRVRALTRKVPPRRDRLDLGEVIREVTPLTQAELQRNEVRWQTRIADGLPLVPGDQVQLQQVIINLVVNAVEAMSEVVDRPRELTIVAGKGDSNELFVEVQDTGPGLDQANLDRLFHSFYTTKPEGMGMGLAISRSIVEAHGGRLSAAPNEPHGAVFRFTLPVEGASSPHLYGAFPVK